MRQPLAPDHPLRRLFSGTVQQVLYADMGMCDPQIAEYLSDLLSSFIHMDDVYPFHNAAGVRLENLADIVAEAALPPDTPDSMRQRIIHRHIGDVTLFWTGVFPEGLRRVRTTPGEGLFHDYLEQGKRSYSIASELTHDDESPPATVLRRLSDRFEYCVYGLHRCRLEWDALRHRAAQG